MGVIRPNQPPGDDNRGCEKLAAQHQGDAERALMAWRLAGRRVDVSIGGGRASSATRRMTRAAICKRWRRRGDRWRLGTAKSGGMLAPANVDCGRKSEAAHLSALTLDAHALAASPTVNRATSTLRFRVALSLAVMSSTALRCDGARWRGDVWPLCQPPASRGRRREKAKNIYCPLQGNHRIKPAICDSIRPIVLSATR